MMYVKDITYTIDLRIEQIKQNMGAPVSEELKLKTNLDILSKIERGLKTLKKASRSKNLIEKYENEIEILKKECF